MLNANSRKAAVPMPRLARLMIINHAVQPRPKALVNQIAPSRIVQNWAKRNAGLIVVSHAVQPRPKALVNQIAPSSAARKKIRSNVDLIVPNHVA